jgi:hypothetical protein
MSTADSQQASFNEYFKLELKKSANDVSKPIFNHNYFTRVRPAYLHIFLGLVNDEVSAIRDEKPKLDSADRVLLAAHAVAVEKGEDDEHASITSVDGANAPLTDDWRGAKTSSSTSDDATALPESGGSSRRQPRLPSEQRKGA